MGNRILTAYVAIDGLFAVTGAIMLAFSVIVLQTCFNPPTDGEQAARDLLYQRFPLQGAWKAGHGATRSSGLTRTQLALPTPS